MKYTERNMQAIIMRWLLAEKHHEMVITNSTVLFPWEADLASVTKSGYAHEIEIKISVADFRKDKEKWMKHQTLQQVFTYKPCPNYFWYAAPRGIEIEVPEYAGRLEIYEHRASYHVNELKPAPRLHTRKIEAAKTATIARLLSFRLMDQSWSWMMAEIQRQTEGGAR